MTNVTTLKRGRKAAETETEADAGIGHNNPPEDGVTIAGSQLRSFLERIERLEEEKKSYADDIKDVFAEMKGSGFDTKVARVILKLRKQDKTEREEFESIVEIYKSALGMV